MLLFPSFAIKSATESNLTVIRHRNFRVPLGWGVVRNSASPASGASRIAVKVKAPPNQQFAAKSSEKCEQA